jgi:glutamate synthase (NADPH) small chain
MGKPTGFLDYSRELPQSRKPKDRIGDWSEFREPLPDDRLQRQGARCMDCGLPFCHTGQVLAGMAAGCPINNLIPEWNDLVYRANWREALSRLHKTNNFPEFTGRVCPAPCEGSCVLGISEPPVTIKSIECAIIDRGFEEGWVAAAPPGSRTGKKVAIVGSGPAGLACAAQLNRAGHWVTVFERADRIGGLLMYGIPNMKLDKQLVERRVGMLSDEGVRFVTGAEVGREVEVARLREEFDAIVLCGGASLARDLKVPGRELGGVYLAMDYLTASTRRLLEERSDEPEITARDKHVVVIGGGDTGTDCVATALRQGCRSLTQLEILPKPPKERAEDNPWPQWPKVHRLDYGQEEAAAVFGEDPRQFCVLTKRLLGDDGGQVQALHTVAVEWVRDGSGRSQLREVPGSERSWPAQLVLLAMGFVGAERGPLLEDLGVELDVRGNVATDAKKMTNVAGVFAAGDMARGQSLVVWAIAEGRRAARSVDEFLMGESLLP